MKKLGKKIVISGPSGVGKGSVNSELIKDEKLRLSYSVSMTTREKRNAEIEGINYYFVSVQDFKKAIKNDELIEYAKFIGNYYGTPRKAVEMLTKKGTNVVLEIEVDGATQVIKNEKNVLSIFLMPPSLAELQSRIQLRATETHEVIKARLKKALVEIPLKNNYKYVVKNDTIENAVAKIKDILIREGLTDYSPEESVYETVKNFAKEILIEKYELFLEIIHDIHKNLKGQKLIDKLAEILASKVYHYVLADGDFQALKNKKKVENISETLMLEIDFFSKLK
jgi:guanylate kinase